ncbi:hypothetical protein KNE206_27880 [Kitasatospora sp. NE20-6]|uniref:CU044_5270 family protein n=1 Tax=Kitasatospora sp. NE20-6 TaxID=2859066 RepID=UPI0034DC053C
MNVQPTREPVLPADRHRLLRGHLMNEISSTRQARGGARPYRRLRWAAVPALAGGLALALVLTAGGGTEVSAAEVLDRAASGAAGQPVPDARDGRFVYVRSLVAFSGSNEATHEQVPAGTPHERQLWQSVDGSRPGLLVEEGQRPGRAVKPGDPYPPNPDGSEPLEPNTAPGVNAPTYRFLASLPTRPDELLARIYADTRGAGVSPDQEAFATIGDLLREQLAPPAVTAALYRAAARIPGVTAVPDAVDASGRHGVAVAHTSGGLRTEWIFDRATYAFLGERETRDGEVLGRSAVLERAVVSAAGERP